MKRSSMKGIFVTFLILVVSCFTGVVPVLGVVRSQQLLGAFYYSSYGHYRQWNLSGHQPPATWASNFLPDFGAYESADALYDSNDTRVILWQLGKMRQAGLDFVVSSWWGRDSREDNVLQKILAQVMPRADNPFPELKWAIIYDLENTHDPSVEDITGDLRYLASTFGSFQSILRMHGRIVLFVAGATNDQMDYAWKWSEAAKRVGGFYLVLKVFPDHSKVARTVDAWFQFSPTSRFGYDQYYWGYVSPGFWKYDEPTSRLKRDLKEFEMALIKLRQSNVHFALIETWNGWNEGTQVEPGADKLTGQKYQDLYVDLIRRVMKENSYTVPAQPLEVFGILLLTTVILLVTVPTVSRIARRTRN